MTENSRATGKWSRAGIPHKGWTCIDIEDLEEPNAICEMCETQEIRFVHHMVHQDFLGELGVGCVCAGKMEEDYEGAQRREAVMRNSSSRKRRWLIRKWRTSKVGNPYLNVDGYNIVVYKTHQSQQSIIWGFRLTNKTTNDTLASRKPYSSEEAAKLRAFDAMVWMKNHGR